MRYISTRGEASTLGFIDVTLAGLARDGGLYVPDSWPVFSPEQIAAWAPVPPDAARWQERLAHLHTLVAEFDGVLAGFASYTGEGYLDFLFTHPAFARRGVEWPQEHGGITAGQ